MKSPWAAFFLSLAVPGLGQLYLNEKAKAFSLLCITAGIVLSLALSRSWITFVLLAPLYLFVLIPASLDAYQTAAGNPRTFKGDSVFYVIMMLVIVGPFAIPLLWQSAKFPKGAKIVCTVLVTLIALAAVLTMALIGSIFNEMMKQDAAVLTV